MIDDFLNRITMYRLVLYTLIVWLLAAVLLSSFGIFPFQPAGLIYSTAVLLIVSWITNELFGRVFGSQTNSESVYITALILALLVPPPLAGQYLSAVPFLVWASVLAQASKYILAINKKHIFNPAAVSIALTAFFLNLSANWWIGTATMLPLVLIGGLLITRKIRRFDLVLSFALFALASIALESIGRHDLLLVGRQLLVDSPFVFFALIMLTEPLTTPPTRPRRILYGAFTGLIYGPAVHIGWLYSTPELALCAGNLFSWLLSPKSKYFLTLKRKTKIARDTAEFAFASDRRFSFKPGQYLEWTLAHGKSDSRGNRRYFTVASAPSEKEILLGIRFESKKPSSFKKALAEMDEGRTILAGSLAGDFTLPGNRKTKLCFIAGGIGVTPFRSMISHMLETKDYRDAVLVYSCKTFDEIAYTDIVHRAHDEFGLKTVCTLTDMERLPKDWNGYRGPVNIEMIIREVPDYDQRLFYISGPRGFVEAVRKVLAGLEISKNKIRTDYFPGFA